jgi:hypothetical protein
MILGIDQSLLIAAGASFIVGLIGYIIVRLWMIPILRYTLTRRKLDRDLKHVQSLVGRQPSSDADGNRLGQRVQERSLSARRHAMTLVSCYSKELPYWYRLLLDSRQESPSEASGLLTNIFKMKDAEQIANRMQKVRRAMRLK